MSFDQPWWEVLINNSATVVVVWYEFVGLFLALLGEWWWVLVVFQVCSGGLVVFGRDLWVILVGSIERELLGRREMEGRREKLVFYII